MRLSLRSFIVATTGYWPACFPTMYKDPGTTELCFQTWGDRNKLCLKKSDGTFGLKKHDLVHWWQAVLDGVDPIPLAAYRASTL